MWDQTTNKMRNNINKKGFTLIELLVVIAIIGMLSSVVLASLNTARSKSRDARRLSDINQIQKALDFYYDENGTYPITGWRFSYNSSWDWLETQLADFIPSLPVDPTNDSNPPYYSAGFSYAYYSSGGSSLGQWYMIIFKLENQNVKLDQQDGVWAEYGTFYDYPSAGTADGYVITQGRSD